MNTLQLKPKDSDLFLELLKEYSGYLKSTGRTVKMTTLLNSAPLFDSLEASQRARVISNIEEDLGLFRQAQLEGILLEDSPRLLWRYLVNNGYSPESDLFSHIEKEDVVVFYNLDHRQAFQNFRFFDFVSITLEQLFCHTWNQYTSRDASIEGEMQKVIIRLITGETKATILTDVPEHLVSEVNTPELKEFFLKLKALSPVWKNGALGGVVSINRCRWKT